MSKGRGNGNSITTGSAMKLDINYLIRNKHIQFGKEIHFALTWTNGSEITAVSAWNNNGTFLRLKYSITNNTTNEVKQFDYKIYFDTVKSNLGKGSNLYFLCPQSGNRCKILYLCYGAEMFKSRTAYKHRIYYQTQIASKEDRNNKRFFILERKINRLNEKRKTNTYKGKPTKRNTNLFKLSCKKDFVDELRYKQLDFFLARIIRGNC